MKNKSLIATGAIVAAVLAVWLFKDREVQTPAIQPNKPFHIKMNVSTDKNVTVLKDECRDGGAMCRRAYAYQHDDYWFYYYVMVNPNANYAAGVLPPGGSWSQSNTAPATEEIASTENVTIPLGSDMATPITPDESADMNSNNASGVDAPAIVEGQSYVETPAPAATEAPAAAEASAPSSSDAGSSSGSSDSGSSGGGDGGGGGGGD